MHADGVSRFLSPAHAAARRTGGADRSGRGARRSALAGHRTAWLAGLRTHGQSDRTGLSVPRVGCTVSEGARGVPQADRTPGRAEAIRRGRSGDCNLWPDLPYRPRCVCTGDHASRSGNAPRLARSRTGGLRPGISAALAGRHAGQLFQAAGRTGAASGVCRTGTNRAGRKPYRPGCHGSAVPLFPGAEQCARGAPRVARVPHGQGAAAMDGR